MDSQHRQMPVQADNAPHSAPSRQQKQLSVRSTKAYDTAKWKAVKLGISMTELVERALEDFAREAELVPDGLVRKGKFLVIPSGRQGPKVTAEQVNQLIDDIRNGLADNE
jgi:hypothetical protein